MTYIFRDVRNLLERIDVKPERNTDLRTIERKVVRRSVDMGVHP